MKENIFFSIRIIVTFRVSLVAQQCGKNLNIEVSEIGHLLIALIQ